MGRKALIGTFHPILVIVQARNWVFSDMVVTPSTAPVVVM